VYAPRRMRLGFDAKRVFHNATGLGNYGRDALRILQARRPEHAYLAYSPRPPAAPPPGAGPGLSIRGPSTALWRLLPALWRQAGMVRDLVRDRVDLYHGLTNELPSGIERTGIPAVVTIHDLIFERYPELYPPVDRQIYRAKFRSAARRARLVIAASEETRRDLVERYRVPEARLRVVYQVCHPAFRAPPDPAAAEALRARLGLPGTFVLQVGTIERRKNLLLTLGALTELPDVALVAVGRPTPYLAEIQAFARARRLEGRVRFLEGLTMPELAALYRLAAVAVYPSIVEGFGIPILEAIASGTPVVTTRGGVFPEVGGPGSAYVDPHDPAELRAELESILSDPARRARMRAAGLVHAERFRDEAIADALFRVYEEALG
jgi:glycosyltransferase involved in cell wall biosynthesis